MPLPDMAAYNFSALKLFAIKTRSLEPKVGEEDIL
jgi:hypothetical protein